MWKVIGSIFSQGLGFFFDSHSRDRLNFIYLLLRDRKNLLSFFIIPLLRHFTIYDQENAQNMLLYSTVKLCIALQNPGFSGFLAEGLKKPNFDVLFFFHWNNKSLIRWLNI